MDLGLCQPVNYEATTTKEEKEIFGVIPYIPAEVIRGEKFTSTGDIYSFAMLLWELSTGRPPFMTCIRPEITSPLIPPCIAEIIVKCWDVNPENRSNAREVRDKFEEIKEMYELMDSHEDGEVSKIMCSQFFGIRKLYIKEMLKNDVTTNYSTTTTKTAHQKALYTSCLLTLKMN
ncbi:hypothetical protein G9A89_001821 [Geosiphon pyriformis]|nr:hypothetical protein G9A89_001821 [Geosiphon pyriformis]